MTLRKRDIDWCKPRACNRIGFKKKEGTRGSVRVEGESERRGKE